MRSQRAGRLEPNMPSSLLPIKIHQMFWWAASEFLQIQLS